MNIFKRLWEKIMRRKKPKGPVIIPPPPPPTTTPPTFSESFNSGSLPPFWIVSNWNAPMGGSFSSSHVDFSHGMLGLKLTQKTNELGAIVSTGGEIACNQLFGYGTYEWVAKMSSTAPAPNQVGQSISGSISGLFNYVNNSQTEIDFEVEGNKPALLQMTNYSGGPNNKTSTPVPEVTELHQAFHKYKFIWTPGRIEYYMDDRLIVTHTTNVPSAPAYPMINHWGTNTTNWGGNATTGLERWLWVSHFSFTPL